MHARKITLVVLLAACGGEAAEQRKVAQARAGIARAESTAVQVAALPATGVWSKEHLLERLVRAGVAPRELPDAPKGPAWMGQRAIVVAAGGGEVYAWIYRDSTARKAVTDSLDGSTGAPQGAAPAFAGPLIFVRQNNLAAMITGGSETNQDRIALALQAGLPAAKP
jgi:hypothetical protein